MYGRPPPPQQSSWPPLGPRAGIGAGPPGPPPGAPAGPSSSSRPPPQYTGPPPGYGPGPGPPHLPPHMGGYSGPPPPSAAGVGPGPPPPPPGAATGANLISGPADPSTTVFVGSITPGISDDMLKQLLSTCGTLVNLKRISPAFGFASFDHPEAVMRSIDLLNGLKLPSPANADPSKEKSLVVKADEKTKAFVDQYKVDRGESRSDFEHNLDSTGQSAINNFIETLKSPQALTLFADSSNASASAVPAHLRDLPPEDLPEEHRKSVLGEIDKFRQASAAREEEKKRRERVLERERGAGALPSGPRAGPPSGSASASASTSAAPNGHPQDPNHGLPAGFVRESGAAAGSTSAPSLDDMDPEEADEVAERRRQELKAKDDDRRAKEALNSYTARERNRLAHWTRLHEEETAEKQRSSKVSAQLIERSEKWDQSYEESRELFWVDRPRWRHFRGPMLRREMEEDEADVRLEKEEAEKAALEADKFLARQQEEMKRHLEEQRSKGVLVDGSSMQPLKLNFGGGAGTEPSNSNSAAAAPATEKRPLNRLAGTDGDASDEDDDPSALHLRRRALNIDLNDGLSDSDRRALVATRREEIRSQLSSLSIKWEWVDSNSIDELYRPKIDSLVEENVGERVPELVDVLVSAIREKASRDRIKVLVEPVMAEDAEAFTEQIVRILIEESNVAATGLVR